MKGKWGIDWFEIEKSVVFGCVLASVISMCMSVYQIGLGFHNFDTGHNIAMLNILAKYELNGSVFYDEGTDGQGRITILSDDQLVQIGSLQMRVGWVSLMISSVMFGLFATTLRYMKGREW